jgi:NitT/TauT family transport system ATP-binding protein
VTRKGEAVLEDLAEVVDAPGATVARPVAAAQPVARAPVVDIRGLSLTYEAADGPVYALSNVDLQIQEGEFVSFIGPSGCGKTTLLRVVADLEQPAGGLIKVNGVSPNEARLRRDYGFVFQAPALYPWRTIERNIELPLEIFGLPKAERRARSQAQIELVNLKGFEKKYPWQLSGGMQQRASIARALSFDPKLLLMDEPFGALDAFTRDEMNLLIQRLWMETGKTIIFVTHNVSEAIFLADRVVVLTPRPGRLAHIFPIDLPRPRTIEMTFEPAFIRSVIEIKGTIETGRYGAS